MENNIDQKIRYWEAAKKVKRIKGFYSHLMIYLLVNIFIIVVKAINLDFGENLWEWDLVKLPLLWGIGLVAHGLTVFLPAFIFGKNWEERKIKELINKNK